MRLTATQRRRGISVELRARPESHVLWRRRSVLRFLPPWYPAQTRLTSILPRRPCKAPLSIQACSWILPCDCCGFSFFFEEMLVDHSPSRSSEMTDQTFRDPRGGKPPLQEVRNSEAGF